MIDKVLVTSEDHDQMFGLKQAVNAAQVVQETLGQKLISRVLLDERTGDLSLDFNHCGTIQFLTSSGGYEGWRAGHGDQCVICLGGGNLAIL